MFPAHLHALLQETSSVSIVVDNAKCHVNASTKRSHCLETASSSNNRKSRRQRSRWESEPVVAPSMKSPPTRPNCSNNRNCPLVLKCRQCDVPNDVVTSSLIYSLKQNVVSKNNTTKRSRSSMMEKNFHQLQSSSQLLFPMMKNQSAAKLLAMALDDDVSFGDDGAFQQTRTTSMQACADC